MSDALAIKLAVNSLHNSSHVYPQTTCTDVLSATFLSADEPLTTAVSR